MKTLVVLGVKVGLVVAFGGLAVLGVGLMASAVVYPTGPFWGVMTFLLGVLAVLLTAGAALTVVNRHPTRAA